MVVVAVMVLVGVLVVSLVVMKYVRDGILAEGRLEARLRRPGALTVSYTVPDGQDPAVLMAALRHAGFTSVAAGRGGTELLLVELTHDHQRSDVRRVLEDVHRTSFDGVETHVGPVRFEDEPSS